MKIQFTRMKMNLPSVDSTYRTGTRVLLATKRYKLLVSFSISPKLSPDKCNMTLVTRIRLVGKSTFEPLNWTAQSLYQTKSDLTQHLNCNESEDLRNFLKSLSPRDGGSNTDQPVKSTTQRRNKKSAK